MLIVVDAATARPLLLPLLYLSLHRRYVRFKTLRRDAHAIKALYFWFYSVSKEPIDLEVYLQKGEILPPAQIEAFSRWLRVRALYSASDDERSVLQLADQFSPLTPATLHNYLGAIQRFLLWCLRRYLPSEALALAAAATYVPQSDMLRDLFRSIKVRGKRPTQVSGLESEVLNSLRQIVQPDHPDNPFRPSLRFRNALIVELLLATGIRRGELLKLKTDDIGSDQNGRCFLRVQVHRDDPSDPRRNEPGQKTGSRVVSIPPVLFDQLIRYIQAFRRPKRDGRPMKLAQTYLFLSERGRPLAESQVNQLLSRLGQRIGYQLHPHSLRHTFCHAFIEYCSDHVGQDHEASQDQLRVLCGWSARSAMPQRYTQRFLREQADRHNLERQRLARAESSEVKG